VIAALAVGCASPTADTTTSPPASDDVTTTGEVQGPTEDDVAALEFFAFIEELMNRWEDDSLDRWFQAWSDRGDPEGAIDGLVGIGQDVCAATAEAKASGVSARDNAWMLLRWTSEIGGSDSESEWVSLSFAAAMAASQAFCPDLGDYVMTGWAELEQERDELGG
jgi:hypothetical protein